MWRSRVLSTEGFQTFDPEVEVGTLFSDRGETDQCGRLRADRRFRVFVVRELSNDAFQKGPCLGRR